MYKCKRKTQIALECYRSIIIKSAPSANKGGSYSNMSTHKYMHIYLINSNTVATTHEAVQTENDSGGNAWVRLQSGQEQQVLGGRVVGRGLVPRRLGQRASTL